MLAGVVAGLARRLDVNPWGLRALAVLSVFLPGPQFLAYILLWILMPSEP